MAAFFILVLMHAREIMHPPRERTCGADRSLAAYPLTCSHPSSHERGRQAAAATATPVFQLWLPPVMLKPGFGLHLDQFEAEGALNDFALHRGDQAGFAVGKAVLSACGSPNGCLLTPLAKLTSQLRLPLLAKAGLTGLPS